MREKVINVELLEEYINKSGLKIAFIAEKLGISRQAFDKKRNGDTACRVSEVYVICDLLNIPEDEKPKFFTQKVKL